MKTAPIFLLIFIMIDARNVQAGFPWYYPPPPPPCTTCPCPPGSGGSGGSGGFGGSGASPGAGGGCSICGLNTPAGGASDATGGMPDWRVNEPNIDLRLHDEPLAYESSVSRVSFQMDYWQRDDRVPTNNIFTMGPGWECSWQAWIDTDGTVNDAVLLHGAGGGEIVFQDLTGTSPNYYNNLRMLSQADTNGKLTGYQVFHPNGAEDDYDFLVSNTDGVASQAYLSKKIDPHGHTTTFIYSPFNPATGVVQLNYVIDPDGKTNTLTYTNNGTFNYLISQVRDPFGHTVSFDYDGDGYLTNVTDVSGLSSSFAYGAFPGSDNSAYYWDGYEWYGNTFYNATNYWLDRLTTPYGATSFTFTDDSLQGYDVVNRSVIVTEPNGSHQMFTHRGYTSFVSSLLNPSNIPSSTPDGSGLDDGWLMVYRNSFYWGRQQFADLSAAFLATGATNWDFTQLTTNDYLKARWRKWAHSPDGGQGDALTMEQEPSPDGTTPGQMTWFTYPNQGASYYEGSSSMPTLEIKVLPDGSQWYDWYQVDQWGNRTNAISTYSLPDGSVGTRTNSYVYAANGQDLLQAIGPDGVTNAAYGYDANHQVLAMTNALGEITRYTYDANEYRTSITSPDGLVTTNIYNSDGFLEQQIVEDFSTNRYTYTNGLVYTHTDERGLTVTNSWDALQRLTNAAYPDGTSVAYLYNDPSRPLDLVKVTDRMGFSTGYAYNSIRQKTFETNALGRVTAYSYCECGALESISDALGNVTTFTHDNQGNLTKIVYPDYYTVTNSYNLLHQLVVRGDSSEMNITNYYNNQGLLVTSSNNVGLVRSMTYDINDLATNSVDANGVSVSMTYDNLHRLLSRKYPDNGVEHYGYTHDVSGPTSYTNQINNVELYAYDRLNRKTNEVYMGVTTNRFAYNGAGDLLTLTDGKNQTTTWIYDQYGRVTNKLDAAMNLLFVYQYDPDNRLTNRWSLAKGNTAYSYDDVGNLTYVDYPNSPDISLSYDALNRLTNMVDAVGTTVYGYDTAGQLLSEDGPWADDTVSYSYNNRLRTSLNVTAPNASAWTQSYGYDAARRLQTADSPAGEFVYTYDPARQQRVEGLSLPGGAEITNSFDSVARLTGTWLRSSGGADLDSYAYGYDQANQRTNVVRTAGDHVSYTYDNMGELMSATGKESGGANRWQEQFNYTYDAAGNLHSRVNYTFGQYFYANNLNELYSAADAGGVTVAGSTTSPATNVMVNSHPAILYADNTFVLTNWTYGPGQNVFTAVAKDVYGRQSTQSISVNLQFINSAYAYDNNGNLTSDGTRNFAYDDENQLISVMVTNAWKSEFTYDGKLRRRIVKEFTWNAGTSGWQQTNEVHYIYDGNLVVQERDANNLPQVTYTRGNDLSGTLQGAGGIGGLLARTDNSKQLVSDPFASAFYHADGNGNVTCLIYTNQTIAAKYLYDPYGNMLSIYGSLADANNYRFSSKEWDVNSGLYYYLYRFYDPNLQRWPNRDPLGDVGSCVNLMMLNSGVVGMGFPWERLDSPNLYTFVADNPQDQNDPFGLWQWGWPPWGNPKPKPSPKPSPPTCPAPTPPKPKTPCDDWKTDKPGPAKQADCSLCCEQQFIVNEAKHPKDGFENAMREKACNSMCLLSNGDKGPK